MLNVFCRITKISYISKEKNKGEKKREKQTRGKGRSISAPYKCPDTLTSKCLGHEGIQKF